MSTIVGNGMTFNVPTDQATGSGESRKGETIRQRQWISKTRKEQKQVGGRKRNQIKSNMIKPNQTKKSMRSHNFALPLISVGKPAP